MATSRFGISRRMVLRGIASGAAVSVGLPLLEAMLGSNGDAYADGTALPKRFGIYFWGGGVPWSTLHGQSQPDLWTPKNTGANLVLNDMMKPLAGMEDKLLVVSGLEPKTQYPPNRTSGDEDRHLRTAAVMLTSDRPINTVNDPVTSSFARATVDQVMATNARVNGPAVGTTPFRSIQAGVIDQRNFNAGHWLAISQSGTNQLNLPIYDPGQLFDQLFGNVQPPSPDKTLRVNVLDAVAADAKALQRRLGSADRKRLTAHTDNISALHQRLTSAAKACTAPQRPGNPGDPKEKMRLMASIVTLALQCDLTRVFTLMFSQAGSGHTFGEVGVGGSFHQDVLHKGQYDEVKAVTVYQMEAYRILLDSLAAAKEPDGTSLLDTCCIAGISEYGEGYGHSDKECPFVFAGNARGALRTNMHLREPGGNIAKAHLTAFRAMGADITSYGFSGSETSTPIAGALV